MNDDASPFVLFGRWYGEAQAVSVENPNAMALSTVDGDDQPRSRIVLLKSWDEEGFVFFTNYESGKALELMANPQASLLFFWDSLGKQIRIEGCTEKTTREISEAYFKSRPLESQWGAWASLQSRKLASRDALEERYRQAQEKHPEQVPLPEFWGGFRLIPHTFEFWEAGIHRLHTRTVYERLEMSWNSCQLYP